MKSKTPTFLKYINFILILILLIKIGGYFSIVEERSINQIFKTVSRIGMTVWIFFIYSKLKKHGCISTFEKDGLLAPLLYALYLVLGFASFSWSTDPFYSALQWAMTMESFVFTIIFIKVVVVINYHFPDKQIDLVKLFSWAIFPIMLIYLIGSFIEPDSFYRGMRGGEEKRLGGWIMNPNELGMLASISASLAYLYSQKENKIFWPILFFFLSIVILVLTSSRSSAIGFILILGILILKSKNVLLKRTMIAATFIIVPLFINFVILKDSGGIEEVMSMTGRLPFWKALLNEGIVREPFFGYGFMRINYTDYFQGLNTYPGKMTHNTFMQVLMNLGFVGFFIAIIQLSQTIRNFIVNKTNQYNTFFIAILIPILINSFTEFGIFGEANYAILFYHFLVLLFIFKIPSKLSKQDQLKLKLFKRK
ncbi:MAG: O-antigen ligase family protein [Crocinitomicaceae bacterium]|nr:O-antigen ligase family protein [Crocinitomicaceae bacterium]